MEEKVAEKPHARVPDAPPIGEYSGWKLRQQNLDGGRGEIFNDLLTGGVSRVAQELVFISQRLEMLNLYWTESGFLMTTVKSFSTK